MGSRSFYEGWDSNRPNVANFINIGVGTDARKFILQSVGRGVRIEPLQGRRQRLKFLNNAGLLAKGVYGQIQDDAQADIVHRWFVQRCSWPEAMNESAEQRTSTTE
ncbi:MAG TPA: hypothetical protein VMH22_11740 [bacterium]|nr:hypothetical protein [bacterium]